MFYPTLHRHVAHDEMLEMSKRGHQIKVVAVWGGEKDLDKPLPFPVIYLKQKIYWFNLIKLAIKYKNKFFTHLKESFRYMGKVDSLRFSSQYPRIKLENYDRIHAHFASNNALKGYLVSKFYKKPFSCTAHGSEILVYSQKNLKELILKSRPFITISEYNRKFLVEKYEIPEDKIIVNYCGVDINFFKRKEKHKNGIFTIISVAALKPVKGLNYLLEACGALTKKGLNLNLKIAGHGPEYNNLKRQIRKLKLEGKVKLLGVLNKEKLRDELENSTIFVLPSLSEGIPIALMEAMSMELPVVATNITGIPELIDDGINGLLVEKANSEDLANKIELLYNDPDLREKLAKNARRKVCEKFNLRKNVEKFEKILNEYS